MNPMGEIWTQLGSSIATMMFVYTMYQNYFPQQLRAQIRRYTSKFTSFFYPYIHITFDEFDGEYWFDRSKAFTAIERYLGVNSSSQAKRLKAKSVREKENVVILGMDDHEEVTDEYKRIKLWWSSNQSIPNRQSISFYPREDGKRYFRLTFHKKHRDVVTEEYLKHILEEGKAISVRERQRKLYTNNKTDNSYGFRGGGVWSQIVFKHPASFDTLAMEPKKKQEILDDLITFTKSKDYYAKIGKAWKRGYLLYGPPGTGKSTMIAAMANFLQYDVYDIELTAVKDNTELRKLLISTSSKSIIVIEDIDCSLDLTGQREKNKKEKKKEEKKDETKKDPVEKEVKKAMDEDKKKSEVTLSGLLNCIDGLWSTCGEERIFVFTTNFMEKLDPALIRRGRMDKHIEMSYCGFGAFKALAKIYLEIQDHHLFPTIDRLLGEANMVPADVAENLLPKSPDDDADTCLEKLIKALEESIEEAKLKADEEKKLKAEEEEKRLKAEEEEKRLKAEEEEKKKKEENGKAEEVVVLDKDLKENGHVSSVA